MRTVLFAAALSFAAIAGCSKPDPSAAGAKAEDKVPSMTVDEVDRALAAKEAVPVDCNGDKTRKKKGVLPGAILISDEESFAASELPANKATKLVFYCADSG
jgi:hypothetical protein